MGGALSLFNIVLIRVLRWSVEFLGSSSMGQFKVA